ncbi:twin-arginine translocation pathway signal [Halomonas litopenaei]|nr:twin-arginine translocation pathway signal [Halomonas litopenaei]
MSTTPNTQRRRLLKALGGGTVAAGAAVAVGQASVAVARDDSATTATEKPDDSAGYRETEHVRAFYASLRD